MKLISIRTPGILMIGLLAACSGNTESNDSEAEASATAPATAISYIADQQQTVIEWRGEKVTGDFHTGTVGLKSGHFELKDGKIVSGEFVVNMDAISVSNIPDPGKEQYFLGHLKGPDFFEVATFPEAKFTIVEGTADSLRANLTIKGITHVITIPYTIQQAGNTIEVNTEFAIDRASYNVQYGSGSFFDDLGDKLILDSIPFKVKLVAANKAG